MKKSILSLISILLFISCNKAELTWELKRLSPKDGKQGVSELIYSNSCTTFNGLQVKASGPGTPSSFYWTISNTGISGNCFKTEGDPTNASIEFNINMTDDRILRFYFKSKSFVNESNNIPTVYLNSSVINSSIIAGNENVNGDWLQIQTERLKKGNNILKIQFVRGTFMTYYIDEIELWSPIL
jgi:hypothetical protein